MRNNEYEVHCETVLTRKKCKQKNRKEGLSFTVFHNSPGITRKPSMNNLKEKWEGACLDTGAQKTVIGLSQAKSYCRFVGTKFKPRPNKNRYRFGSDRQQSLGSVTICIPFGSYIICEDVDVVKANVPFLFGLDLMDKYHLYVNTVCNTLCSSDSKIEAHLTRKLGHVYLEWNTSDTIHYTRVELKKLHRAFSHPAPDKLFNLLKLARPDETNEETRRILEEIRTSCNACQRYGPTPLRFKTSLPNEDDLKFGDEISMDLMFLDGKPVLHIVDTATRFSAATFLDAHGEEYGQSVEGIWKAFIETWCLLYIGYPNRLRTDQGAAFTSDRWRALSNQCGIQLRLSGVKAHSSLGIGERLHDPLRRIYRKIIEDHPDVNPREALKIAVKAMNDTIGENGLVPTRLVFGMLPRYPILSQDVPTQNERMKAPTSAQMEMNRIVSERKVLTALNRDIPPAADRSYRLGEEVLVYSETEKKWIGPYIVTH